MLEGGSYKRVGLYRGVGFERYEGFLEIAAYRGRERLIRENCLRKGLIAEKDILIR